MIHSIKTDDMDVQVTNICTVFCFAGPQTALTTCSTVSKYAAIAQINCRG